MLCPKFEVHSEEYMYEYKKKIIFLLGPQGKFYLFGLFFSSDRAVITAVTLLYCHHVCFLIGCSRLLSDRLWVPLQPPHRNDSGLPNFIISTVEQITYTGIRPTRKLPNKSNFLDNEVVK